MTDSCEAAIMMMVNVISHQEATLPKIRQNNQRLLHVITLTSSASPVLSETEMSAFFGAPAQRHRKLIITSLVPAKEQQLARLSPEACNASPEVVACAELIRRAALLSGRHHKDNHDKSIDFVPIGRACMHRTASHPRDDVAGSLCLVFNKRDLPPKILRAEGKDRLYDPPCTIYGLCLPVTIREDPKIVHEECSHTGRMPLEAIETSAQPSRHHKITDKASFTAISFRLADAESDQGHCTSRKLIPTGRRTLNETLNGLGKCCFAPIHNQERLLLVDWNTL